MNQRLAGEKWTALTRPLASVSLQLLSIDRHWLESKLLSGRTSPGGAHSEYITCLFFTPS